MSGSSSSSQESEPHWQEASPVPQPSNNPSARNEGESDADMMIRHQQELERMIEQNFAQGDDSDDYADIDFQE